jgi:hypothetical protein
LFGRSDKIWKNRRSNTGIVEIHFRHGGGENAGNAPQASSPCQVVTVRIILGISCFLTLSLVILISMFFFPATIQLALIVSIFVVGMGAMLIGVWFEVSEMWTSFRGLALEYEIHRRRIKK